MLSPILSNIYLHKLDRFVETVLIPQYTRGEQRAANPDYTRAAAQRTRARIRGDRTQARALRTTMWAMPSRDTNDPGYRRLRYIRYADDHLLGFNGPKSETEEIKQRLVQFLRDDLKLELNQDKTLITHARTGAARFLGYEITVQHSNTRIIHGRRSLHGQIALRMPRTVIQEKCSRYMRHGRAAVRTQILNRDDYTIVATYGAEYRGIVQYYLHAGDVHRLHRLHWIMLSSMLRTLASKHHSTPTKIAAKHKAIIATSSGRRTSFHAVMHREGRKPLVARFGGIPLQRQKSAVLSDRQPDGQHHPRKQLVTRLLARRCELCEQLGPMEVHHVRNLAELGPTDPAQPAWAAIMARRRRKALVVCAPCHGHIHATQPALTG